LSDLLRLPAGARIFLKVFQRIPDLPAFGVTELIGSKE
jgi:hypothetical protein